MEPGSLSFVFTNQHTEKGGNDKNGMDCRQQESAGESLSATSTVSVAAHLEKISLKELDSANEAKPATEFKFVFRSLEDTKPSDSRGN